MGKKETPREEVSMMWVCLQIFGSEIKTEVVENEIVVIVFT